uniref:Putative 8.9 kDa protein n=1 Tax=Ixodes ricinus TaxID=34613 RepID=A0A6B0TQN6_IXORI
MTRTAKWPVLVIFVHVDATSIASDIAPFNSECFCCCIAKPEFTRVLKCFKASIFECLIAVLACTVFK